MKKNKLLTRVLISALVVATPISAIAEAEKEKKTPGSGPNPFSDCGIGAAMFSETKWAAVTSNVIWDAGTTAVTSAISSPQTCNGKRVETAQFIIDNYDNIVEETARGRGEHLTAMLQVRGCDAKAHADIVSEVRSDMGQVVGKSGYENQSLTQKASDLFDAVDSVVNRNYAHSCSA